MRRIWQESEKVIHSFIDDNASGIATAAQKIAEAFAGDHRLFLCGNGGSAADAQHLAAEFVNRFQLERPPLPAIALTTDTSVITSIGNDYSFDEIFAKQIKANGTDGDVLLAISTSGNSRNVVEAVKVAARRGIYTIGLLGGEGGDLKSLVNLALVAKCRVTARVQEAHILAGHIICHLTDYILFEKHLQGL
ncbi:MAG: SIS domain-containing protein [Desulfobacteraceae bacterium]|nr:MAG: SIS domain-containing protein [Desulfobacteraceae bacterium]